MKKKIFISLMCLVTFGVADAQKLKVNEIDKFTKQKRLETSAANLKNRLAEGLMVSFRTVDTINFVIISGYGFGSGVIGNNDEAIFLLKDESTVHVYSTGIQSYEIGKYQNTYRHQYRITLEDLKRLASNDVTSVRKYMSKGYVDIEIPEKNQSDVKKIAALILSEIE